MRLSSLESHNAGLIVGEFDLHQPAGPEFARMNYISDGP